MILQVPAPIYILGTWLYLSSGVIGAMAHLVVFSWTSFPSQVDQCVPGTTDQTPHQWQLCIGNVQECPTASIFKLLKMLTW